LALAGDTGLGRAPGFLLLFRFCGGFLVLDTLLVNRWRVEILRMWIEEGLELGVFVSTHRQYQDSSSTHWGPCAFLANAGHPLAGIDQSASKRLRGENPHHAPTNRKAIEVLGVLAYSAVLASIAGAVELNDCNTYGDAWRQLSFSLRPVHPLPSARQWNDERPSRKSNGTIVEFLYAQSQERWAECLPSSEWVEK